jgi:hypothetical protein
MMEPMMKPERRRAPRMTLQGLAYITLDLGNGGMILNVSEGGLCFRAVVPVQNTGTIHFWFSEPNVRIEADGELAWSDEMQKKGGLRFTNLSAESRQQIRHWMNQPAPLVTADRRYAPPLPSPPKSPAMGASPSNSNTARSGLATPQMLSLKKKAQGILKGFPGGLATGLLVSVVFSAALLIHSHRERFGESLIRWGERLGARSKLQTAPAEPRTERQETTTAASPSSALSAGIPGYQPYEQASKPVLSAIKVEPSLNQPKIPPKIPLLSAPISVPSAVNSAVFAPPSLPVIPVTPTSDFDPGVFASVPPPTNFFANRTEASKEAGLELPSSKYLEVGKFKEKLLADRTTDRLTQLGFHAIVTERGHLWTSSYYVLVGPYNKDREFEAAHKGLASWGFKSRSLERGSRSFTLRSGLKMNGQLSLNGTPIPFGDYVISWESYASEAVVKFEGEHSVVFSTVGKLAKLPIWHEHNAFVYKRNADGSQTLLEIRFGGTNQTLVFGKSS